MTQVHRNQSAVQSIQEVVWVTGHRNIAGNIKADKLGRAATLIHFMDPEPALTQHYKIL